MRRPRQNRNQNRFLRRSVDRVTRGRGVQLAVELAVQKGRVILANALAEWGVRVVCVLPEAKGPYLKNLSPQVELVDLGTRRPIAVVRIFAEFLRQERPFAVIASQQHTALAALWARRLTGVEVPVTFTQHATLSALCRQSRRPAMRWLMPLFARLFFP